MHPLSGTPVLVTGATGFLGARIAEMLASDAQACVTGTGRDLKKAARLHGAGVNLHAADLMDEDAMREALKGAQVVIHAAALLIADARAAYTANVTGTEQLVRLAAEAGVKRLVHISTVGVYDMKSLDAVPEETPLAIRHPSTYPRTKALAEVAVRETAAAQGMEFAIVRPSPM